MATVDPTPVAAKSFGEKLMSVSRHTLYGLLIVATSIPLFLTITVPNEPSESSVDFYTMVMSIPEGSTILIESDWTKSTRGESMGQFEALMRMLMRRDVKFALYSTADPQAPQVARDAIDRLNEERRAKGERLYERWNDWVNLGYFPNAEGTNNAVVSNIRKAFAGRTESPGDGSAPTDVFRSPVLEDIKNVRDFPLVIVVTASRTFEIIVERLSGSGGVTLAAMVTGVMGPESLVYYSSGQVKGLCVGLKGVYDLESMMETGVNHPVGKPVVTNPKSKEVIEGFPGQQNAGKGFAYYPTLHVALTLMILAVIVGNIGMALTKKGGR